MKRSIKRSETMAVAKLSKEEGAEATLSVQKILSGNGKTLSPGQVEKMIGFALDQMLNKVYGPQLLDAIRENLTKIYIQWRRVSGRTTVVVSYVAPRQISIPSKIALIRNLFSHDMVDIAYEDEVLRERLVGKGDRLTSIPLVFPFEPTREEIERHLIDLLESQMEPGVGGNQ